MPELRVSIHMLNAHETFRKYSRVLRPNMPLSHLRSVRLIETFF